MRIIQTRHRYPLFFIGILMMSAAGFLYRYLGVSVGVTAALVGTGFAIFVLSIALP